MKKIIFIFAIFLLLFFIYIMNIDEKIYYLSLGDASALGATSTGGIDYGYSDQIKDYFLKKDKLKDYVNGFSTFNYRTTDLLRDIETNRKIIHNETTISLKQALVKADIITLSIGVSDINGAINLDFGYKYIDEAIVDMEKLLKIIREYSKEKIIAVGYYNYEENDYFEYANKKYRNLCAKYNIIYIDIYKEISNEKYFPNKNKLYPTKEGYQLIGEAIINAIK